MNGTPVWELLASKAQREVQQAQQQLAEAQLRKDQAIEREQKLDQLLIEYAERLNSIQRRAHSTTEAGNYRNFIVQLQSIKSRSSAEFETLDTACKNARQDVIHADQERLKIERLVERDKQQRQQARDQRESRAAEAESMIQFNLRDRLQR
ncbi:MAG: flagellar FliJ family protein [Porticoccaceae bacterium]|jgi:flagellar export protein FliJ|nr:flagellar FliJ family protein [Porticoccaceae bacterium]